MPFSRLSQRFSIALTPKTAFKAASVLFGLLLVAYTTQLLVQSASHGGMPWNIPWHLVALSTGCYLLSHVMRVMRLVILAEDPRISIRSMLIEQYKANGVNLALPFRLGEAYRVIFFKQFFGSYYRSFIFLLTERIFDFTTILGIFYLAQYFAPTWGAHFTHVNIFAALLVAGIIGLFFVGEEFWGIIHRIFLSRATSPVSVKIVKISGHFLRAIHDVKAILRKRLLACLGFTVVIWGLEVGGFIMFAQVLGMQIDALLTLAALVFLSSLLPSGPVGYGGVQLAFHWVGAMWLIPGLVAYSVWYNMFIFLPGILLALVLFAGLINRKRNKAKPHDQ